LTNHYCSNPKIGPSRALLLEQLDKTLDLIGFLLNLSENYLEKAYSIPNLSSETLIGNFPHKQNI